MTRCCAVEEVCHLALAMAASLFIVVATATLSLALYRPRVEEFVALHWCIFALVCLQAIALQVHRCFDSSRAWSGAVSSVYVASLGAVAACLWVRYEYECSIECHSAARLVLDKPTLLRSHDVHSAAQYSAIVAAIATLTCGARWVSVALVRSARREHDLLDADLVARTHRTSRQRTQRLDRTQPIHLNTMGELEMMPDSGDDDDVESH